MKTDFDVHIHVDLGVTPELVALVNAVIGHRQMPTVQTAQPASEQPEAPAPKPKRGRKTAEPEPEPQPEAEAPEVTEQPTDEPEPQPEAEAPQPEASQEPKELTEQDIREAMHRTRQRIEGENYKEETDSELYKKFHRQLTAQFKQIAAFLGADKPSALPLEQRASFIRQCDELVVEGDTITTKVPY